MAHTAVPMPPPPAPATTTVFPRTPSSNGVTNPWPSMPRVLDGSAVLVTHTTTTLGRHVAEALGGLGASVATSSGPVRRS